MPQPYVLIPPAGNEPADEWIRLGMEAQLSAQTLPDVNARNAKFADADRHYRHALRLDPRHALATQNLGVLQAQLGQLTEALLTSERAALFDGDTALIHVNRAFMNLEADRIEDALAAAKHAVAVSKPEDQPGYVNSRFALAMLSATAGTPGDAIALYNQMLAAEPQHAVAAINAAFVQTLTTATPGELRLQRDRWYAANRYQGEKKPHPNERNPERPLRVGYVGGDFKRHSAAMIFGNVVLQHDVSTIATFLYSSLPVDPAADDMTRRFQSAGTWRDIAAMTDEQAEDLIRRDQIDILVDLAAHTNGGRLALFTRKPAPVQVTAWGFAHGTGCPEIDYFFADPVAVPPEERGHYAEQIIDLPCIVTYLEPKEYGLKGTSPLPYHRNECVTFGCYARYEKLSDDYLWTIGAILRRVPESRVEFKDHAFRRPYSIRRVLATMPDIDPKRLLFSISTTHPEHMQSYQNCDLILNPFPHSGGLVSAEQLWMGVPFVTLYGTQAAGRTGASILTAMGRTDWIARTPAEYANIAVRLAGDISLLGKVRKTLRQEFLDSGVVKGYVEAVEAAYRTLWRQWCQAARG